MSKIDLNALGDIIDTTWGKTSTPKVSSYSVKFSLQGDTLIASYGAIVNFSSAHEMSREKMKYFDESREVIDAVVGNVKDMYKKRTGSSLKLKEISSNDSVEVKNFNVHNARRSAYIRRVTIFQLA